MGDPTDIRSLAVSAEDVVDAFVYTRENPGRAVLRATPPFHGRMRARLHVVHGPRDGPAAGTIHVSPAALLADPVVDSYPTLEDASSTLPDDPGEGDPAADADGEAPRIRRARAGAIDGWRERAASSIVDELALEVGGERRRVEVVVLE